LYSSVVQGCVTGWMIGGSSPVSRPTLGATQPPIQWVPGALYLGVKRSRREAAHLPPSTTEVKNAWSYTSTP
jgi:hypothetical protein